MIGRIIDIQNTGYYLSKDRGFLLIQDKGEEKGRIPLSDIDALILGGQGNTVSTTLLHAMQESGAIVILTGQNHHPSNILWPIAAHYQHHARLHLQIAMAKPFQKRLWQSVIQAKIRHQGEILWSLTGKDAGLLAFAKEVKSGDPDNREAQAARRYWTALMGTSFRRDPDAQDANGLLNYGYAIIRAAMARAVAASGLHPALGIHHSNKNNPFCLVDDLMEVFRPLVDWRVRGLMDAGTASVTPETKKSLVELLRLDLHSENGRSPVGNCIQKMAQSYVCSMESKKNLLQFPVAILPLGQMTVDFDNA